MSTAHLIGRDNKLYCLPIPCLAFTEGNVVVNWYIYKQAFGGGIINWLGWFFDKRLTNENNELLLHYKYMYENICHTWKGMNFIYHDTHGSF
jgi:hypothetical protein